MTISSGRVQIWPEVLIVMSLSGFEARRVERQYRGYELRLCQAQQLVAGARQPGHQPRRLDPQRYPAKPAVTLDALKNYRGDALSFAQQFAGCCINCA